MLQFSDDPEIAEQQMRAIIFHLTALGYIDGDFDLNERDFVRTYIRKLVHNRAKSAMPDASDEFIEEVVGRFTKHFHEVFEQIDSEVQSLFTEAVAEGEKQEDFVFAKLKLRSYEIFQSFDHKNQTQLLSVIDELIMADGTVHPNEESFRAELKGLLAHDAGTDDDSGAAALLDVKIVEAAKAEMSEDVHHEALTGIEEHYSKDPQRLKEQADADRALIAEFMKELNKQKEAGRGKLGNANVVDDLKGEKPFLDEHVYVHPVGDDEKIEATILGDLHGCYSCLKASLFQSHFLAKVEAYRLNPSMPKPLLVLLGDYIDRGHFSYNGVLRAVMRIYLSAPEHVFVLRGNHEHYIEYKGRVYGGVKPAEAITTLIGHMPDEMFMLYMKMFEALPTSLLLGRTLFVHAGIPRDATIRDRFEGLRSLNDSKVRFEMMWSDPSKAMIIPEELQAQNARFPFGQRQFESFMARIGCGAMWRGHEKVDSGFAKIYPSGKAQLFNLFSAGGEDNDDLPTNSSYRSVTPMAATLLLEGSSAEVRTWPIEYKRFNNPQTNAFFAQRPEIEFRTKLGD